ncbi:MAG: hypothetical protein Q8K78_15450 [Planctomycetaceae bacterium]|nr:hypothetical protein [Planctomycetaceae bacterium]
MNRTGCWGIAILVGVITATVIAEEPTPSGVARLTALPMSTEPVIDHQPFVNLDVRLIELHGKVRLPVPSRKDSARRGNESRFLTADQLATVRETWKSEPDAKILAAARLRMKLGAKGEYRKGREIPVAEPNGKAAAVLRKTFCGTAIDATFTGLTAEAIAVDMTIAHSPPDGNEPADGCRMSTTLALEEGKTRMLSLGKTEQTSPAARVPFLGKFPGLRNATFARDELEEHELIVLITPRLEAAGTE